MRLGSFIAATMLAASVSLSSPVKAQDTIKVGIDAAYKPFAFVEANGELAGFEVELTKAVCAEINVTCEVANVPWDGIWTALETGTIDMVGTTVTKTKPRLEKYAATKVIYKVGYAFLVPEGADTSGGLAGLKGKTIGTIVGNQPMYDYIKSTLGETEIQGYDSPDAAVLDLDAGRIEAFVGDNLQLQDQFVRGGKYKFVDKPNFDPAFVGDGRGWFFRKGSDDLIAKVDKGLEAITASGKLDELGMKFLDTKLSSQ